MASLIYLVLDWRWATMYAEARTQVKEKLFKGKILRSIFKYKIGEWRHSALHSSLQMKVR